MSASPSARTRPLRSILSVAIAVFACGLGAACEGGFGERRARAFECPSSERVTHLRDIHYPEESCDGAIAHAETHLTGGYFRKACQQLAPAEGLPAKVSDVYVSACEAASELDGFEGGSVVQIDVCCP